MSLRRRDLIMLLGGVAAASPLAARGQQPGVPVIGYLSLGAAEGSDMSLPAFRKGLSEMGYVEGRNVTIEYRWGQNDFSRLPELAADLVRRRVAVIAAPQAAPALAAKAATITIPIIFNAGADAVETGLVASLSRPGGNATGINSMSTELGAKRIEVLHDLLPTATKLGFLTNTNIPNSQQAISSAQAAATAVGSSLRVVAAATNREIDAAFASLAQERIDGLVVTPGVLFNNRRVQLATLAVRHGFPTVFPDRLFAEAGGLMSYAPNSTELGRELGIYVGRVLKGERPAELPVVQPTKFELVINLQTARTLGVEVPPLLLARADEVLE
jgi:putative ABC transport system substrate-binding protein